MAKRLTSDKVMIVCVTSEVTMPVQPAIDNNVDRVHLIHYVKEGGGKDDRADFYNCFYREVESRLVEAGIEVVEHRDSETYIFRKMMAVVYSILLEEVNERGSHVYVNLSAGTPEYSAAAAISAMMFKDVEIFTVSKGYDGRTIDYAQLLENAKKDGQLVGSCSFIGGTYKVERFPISRPDDGLLKAFKIYSVICASSFRNTNSVVIRNLINQKVWMTWKGAEPDMVIKGTSLELEDPSDGYAVMPGREVEHSRRQRGEAVQYCRLYIGEWESRGWIAAIPNSRKYEITDEGRTVLEVFCPQSLISFDESDIAIQRR